jgi:putative nucleotidyltransferase with HDIG domain
MISEGGEHMQTNEAARADLLGRATMLKVIPTVSSIVEKALGLVSDPDSTFSDLTEVVRYDQSISSKIISIANSAYYSRGVEVFNLQRAMMTIGFEEVKKIIMCLIFMNDVLKNLKMKGKDLVELWRHSALVACAAKALSKRMLMEDPQKVFTVSLLHDIGKTVLYMNEEQYPAMLREASMKGKALDVMEKEVFGIDHQEIGYVIGIKWRFPEEFLYAMRYHHEDRTMDKFNNLLTLVRAADNFALPSRREPGPEGFILHEEKEAITEEVRKIVDFLQVE